MNPLTTNSKTRVKILTGRGSHMVEFWIENYITEVEFYKLIRYLLHVIHFRIQ